MEAPNQNINNIIFYRNQIPQAFWTKPIVSIPNKIKNLLYKGELYKFSKKDDKFCLIELGLYQNELYYFKNGQLSGYRKLSFEILQKIAKSDSSEYPYAIKLNVGPKIKTFFTNSKVMMIAWYEKLRKFTLLLNIENEYDIITQIGKGNSSTVFKIKEKSSQEFYAAKIMTFDRICQSNSIMANFKNEIESLRMLKHQSILKLISLYLGAERIYIVTELLEGGNMFERIRKNKKFAEENTAKIMRSLFMLLLYLEENNIVHRDIKLENIFLMPNKDGNNYQIKLIDFGLATKLNGIDYKQSCGTPGCIAPEIYSCNPYDYKVDIFSTGIILYTMLSATIPFYSNNVEIVIKKNYECDIKFPEKYWGNISKEAIYLIKMMVEKNPKNRFRAIDCLNSAWIKMHCHDIEDKEEENLDILEVRGNSRLTTASSIPYLESKFLNFKKSFSMAKGITSFQDLTITTTTLIKSKKQTNKFEDVLCSNCCDEKKDNFMSIEEKVGENLTNSIHMGISLAFFKQGKYIMNPKLMPTQRLSKIMTNCQK